MRAGIDAGGTVINLVKQPAGGHIRAANPQCGAVRCVGQVQDNGPLGLVSALERGDKGAADVRVHPVAADILADSVHALLEQETKLVLSVETLKDMKEKSLL